MQSFKNHAHRPVLTGIGYVLAMIALVSFVQRWRAGGGESLGMVALCGAVLVLLQISRRYTTKLQDRIIKLEMRMRTASLLTAEQQQRLFGQLNNKQIAALRFASDAELPALAERAVRDKLPPKDIKRAVQTWVPDFDRT